MVAPVAMPSVDPRRGRHKRDDGRDRGHRGDPGAVASARPSTGAIAALAVIALVAGTHPAHAGIDPSNLAETAEMTFSDEFDVLDLWDGRRGTWDTTYDWSAGKNGVTLPTNDEQQWYIDALYGPTAAVKPWSVSGGVLSLTAAPAAPAIRPLIDGHAYTSGMLTTHRSFSQRGGYFETRARLPKGQGVWPAIWMLPADGSALPEIDVVETVGSDPDTIYMTVHSKQNGSQIKNGVSAKVDNVSDFHTYGVLWGDEKITFYLDGRSVGTVPSPADGKPLYILVNLAIGGKWPGKPDATTPFPVVMQVDYVRAYTPR